MGMGLVIMSKRPNQKRGSRCIRTGGWSSGGSGSSVAIAGSPKTTRSWSNRVKHGAISPLSASWSAAESRQAPIQTDLERGASVQWVEKNQRECCNER
jgi:hypothetical protein